MREAYSVTRLQLATGKAGKSRAQVGARAAQNRIDLEAPIHGEVGPRTAAARAEMQRAAGGKINASPKRQDQIPAVHIDARATDGDARRHGKSNDGSAQGHLQQRAAWRIAHQDIGDGRRE